MIRLEKFTPSDYNTLISWISNAEDLMQFGGPALTFPLTAEQLDRSLADENRFAFKVVDAESQQTIGHAEIFLTGSSAHLGRILIGDPANRGKGIGKEIVELLLELAFGELGQSIVQLNVFDWNLAAIRCYEKVGFEINPDKKLERMVNGKTCIALNMILSKTDWRANSKRQ